MGNNDRVSKALGDVISALTELKDAWDEQMASYTPQVIISDAPPIEIIEDTRPEEAEAAAPAEPEAAAPAVEIDEPAAPDPVKFEPAKEPTPVMISAPAQGSSSKVCPLCGTPGTEGGKFCLMCGASLVDKPAPVQQPPRKRFCQNCGAELMPGDKFCVSCGAPVQ